MKSFRKALENVKRAINGKDPYHKGDWDQPKPPVYFQSELDKKAARASIASALAKCECAKARATIAGMMVNKIHGQR